MKHYHLHQQAQAEVQLVWGAVAAQIGTNCCRMLNSVSQGLPETRLRTALANVISLQHVSQLLAAPQEHIMHRRACFMKR